MYICSIIYIKNMNNVIHKLTKIKGNLLYNQQSFARFCLYIYIMFLCYRKGNARLRTSSTFSPPNAHASITHNSR